MSVCIKSIGLANGDASVTAVVTTEEEKGRETRWGKPGPEDVRRRSPSESSQHGRKAPIYFSRWRRGGVDQRLKV